MNIKSVIDRRLPGASAAYRRMRDARTVARTSGYETLFGFTLYGDAGLDTSREASREADLFRQEAARCEAVVDVGANAGLFTCLAMQAGKPTLAVEPHPLNVQLLTRTLHVNGFDAAEVYPIALGDRVGLASMYGGGQGASLVQGWGGIQSTYETLVPVLTLDTLLAGRFNGERLLVKVDVEGHEIGVLNGATGTLARDPAPVWIVEHGLTENFAGGANPHFRAVFEVFWDAGYTAATEAGEAVKPDDVDRWIDQGRKDFGGINYRFAR